MSGAEEKITEKLDPVSDPEPMSLIRGSLEG